MCVVCVVCVITYLVLLRRCFYVGKKRVSCVPFMPSKFEFVPLVPFVSFVKFVLFLSFVIFGTFWNVPAHFTRWRVCFGCSFCTVIAGCWIFYQLHKRVAPLRAIGNSVRSRTSFDRLIQNLKYIFQGNGIMYLHVKTYIVNFLCLLILAEPETTARLPISCTLGRRWDIAITM